MTDKRAENWRRVIRWLPSVLLAVGFAALATVASHLLVRNLDAVVSLFVDSDVAKEALGQLKNAEIRPPLWLPLLGGAALALVWQGYRRLRAGRAWLVIPAVAALLLLAVAALAGTLWLTQVNRVPLGTALRILLNLLERGAFQRL